MFNYCGIRGAIVNSSFALQRFQRCCTGLKHWCKKTPKNANSRINFLPPRMKHPVLFVSKHHSGIIICLKSGNVFVLQGLCCTTGPAVPLSPTCTCTRTRILTMKLRSSSKFVFNLKRILSEECDANASNLRFDR